MGASTRDLMDGVAGHDDDVTRTGFELGWDHARYGVTPPPGHLSLASPVRQGWAAGCAVFGPQRRLHHACSGQWLALRLSAWTQGRGFDTLTVTPNYLSQLRATHCPVTRAALTTPVISRICADAAFASGNLATLGLAAAAARTDLQWHEALARSHGRDDTPAGLPAATVGLSPAAWGRLGVLLSFVTPLPHAQAAALPLTVLPPNRLHLLNPIQGLQALLTQWLLRSGWSRKLAAVQALLGPGTAAGDLQRFFLALLARSLAGSHAADAMRRRWSIEDAWQDAEVQQLWRRFALPLGAARSQQLLEAMVAQGLCGQRAVLHSDEQAVDGWQLGPHDAAWQNPVPRRQADATWAHAGASDNRPHHVRPPHHRHSPSGATAARLG